MTHPKTGHECAVLKPWAERNAWTAPDNLDIHIRRGMECSTEPDENRTCDRGTVHCWVDHEAEKDTWYARITAPGGIDGLEWLTHGYSVAEAVESAHDIVQMMYEECKPGQSHCFCRDVTWAGYSFESDSQVTLSKKCCLCAHEYRIQEFEAG